MQPQAHAQSSPSPHGLPHGPDVVDWTDLTRELDRWADSGRPATFWWRDDDALTVTPALDRLLGLARDHQAPLALAVVPAGATAALAASLDG